ncbi:Hypp5173 [Branchiostoma lanceolatum]|uniref:Hypp5173 protein n=1 Tax=Branchiostoma lanceolatum TaxID=7740 RepID=A0A8K0AE67_BRALA|nr:Hypp5173 [Branchiostoma lanceolatum]
MDVPSAVSRMGSGESTETVVRFRRLFPIVTPPKGADQVCRDHLYYLKCYICSPHQHLFYHEETVTMCEEFCDSIFWACANATLEGERISDLYSNGREYCLGRKFRVEKESGGTCYTVPIVAEEAASSANSRHHAAAGIIAPLITSWTLFITAKLTLP